MSKVIPFQSRMSQVHGGGGKPSKKTVNRCTYYNRGVYSETKIGYSCSPPLDENFFFVFLIIRAYLILFEKAIIPRSRYAVRVQLDLFFDRYARVWWVVVGRGDFVTEAEEEWRKKKRKKTTQRAIIDYVRN